MIRLILGSTLLMAATAVSVDAQPLQMVQSTTVSNDTLAPDFRGRVRYFGNHSGIITGPRRESDSRRSSRDCPRPDQGCPEPIGGSLEVELEFDGEVVKGLFRGTGGIADSQLIGRRQGAACRLFDLSDGSVWSGRCDREAFVGTVTSVPNAAIQIELNFEAVGTRTVDFGERERKRREAILRQRRIELLQAQVIGSGPVEQRLEAAVELDSYSWQYDGYVPGSLRNVNRGRERDDRFDVTADFTLESGNQGFVRAQVDRGSIICLEFWDVPGVCRPINPPPPVDIPPPYDPASESSLIVPVAIPESRPGA